MHVGVVLRSPRTAVSMALLLPVASRSEGLLVRFSNHHQHLYVAGAIAARSGQLGMVMV